MPRSILPGALLTLILSTLVLPVADAKQDVTLDLAFGGASTRIICIVDEPDWELYQEVEDVHVPGRRVAVDPGDFVAFDFIERVFDNSEMRLEDGTVVFSPDMLPVRPSPPGPIDQTIGPYDVETPDPSFHVEGIRICVVVPE
jgi:hypothetical protein